MYQKWAFLFDLEVFKKIVVTTQTFFFFVIGKEFMYYEGRAWTRGRIKVRLPLDGRSMLTRGAETRRVIVSDFFFGRSVTCRRI